MKKGLLFSSALLAFVNCFAQADTAGLNIPLKEGRVVYEKVVDAPGKTKTDLYSNAKSWCVTYFKYTKEPIQTEDKDAGRIISKGNLVVPFKGALGNTIPYDDKLMLQLDCKDGKYRYRFYDMSLTSPGPAETGLSTTPEELLMKLIGTGKSPLNNKQAKRMLEGMSMSVKLAESSLNRAMLAKGDDF